MTATGESVRTTNACTGLKGGFLKDAGRVEVSACTLKSSEPQAWSQRAAGPFVRPTLSPSLGDPLRAVA